VLSVTVGREEKVTVVRLRLMGYGWCWVDTLLYFTTQCWEPRVYKVGPLELATVHE